MSDQDNLKTVQSIFEAFGRGDVPAVIGALAEDVRWTVPGPPTVPHFGERRGHQGALEFFAKLGEAVEFTEFEAREYVAQGDDVVVLGGERGRVRATGREFAQEWALVFTLRGGKVTRFRGYEDTAAVAEAFRSR